jgi:hypothetical protein
VQAANAESAAEPAHRRAARYAWALLPARIYDVFLLGRQICGGAMRIVAFINDATTVRDILFHLGELTAPPQMLGTVGRTLNGSLHL